MNLGDAGHRIGDLARGDETKEAADIILSDRIRTIRFQGTMYITGVARCRIQLKGPLDARMIVESRSTSAEIHGLSFDILIVEVHDDIVRS